MRRSTSARLAGAFLGGFLMFGCTPGQRFAVDGGLEAAKRVKDAEAQVLKVSICAMSIGAYYRINSDLERRALDALCGDLDAALASAPDLNTAAAK
jgi:hypothetical protein